MHVIGMHVVEPFAYFLIGMTTPLGTSNGLWLYELETSKMIPGNKKQDVFSVEYSEVNFLFFFRFSVLVIPPFASSSILAFLASIVLLLHSVSSVHAHFYSLIVVFLVPVMGAWHASVRKTTST
jgi:hypothetical protein